MKIKCGAYLIGHSHPSEPRIFYVAQLHGWRCLTCLNKLLIRLHDIILLEAYHVG